MMISFFFIKWLLWSSGGRAAMYNDIYHTSIETRHTGLSEASLLD